jgi:DegT/DnrJ/EryC1/StrS aminotransferase family
LWAKTTSARSLSDALMERFSMPHALVTGRAALGLFLVLKCWRGMRETCRVAVPAAVCPEVVMAIVAADCEPWFCDIDVHDGLVPHSEWRRARAAGVDAAIVVHLYGNPARVSPVRELFAAPHCLVVDDAAQALGSTSEDGPAGGVGDVGLLSFGRTKHITLGNAALMIRDQALGEQVSAMLKSVKPASEAERAMAESTFRSRLNRALARLRSEGSAAAEAFDGLTRGIETLLFPPVTRHIDEAVRLALDDFGTAIAARTAKTALWNELLAESVLQPVGMAEGSVPWRYTCRLPGLNWQTQHEISEALRRKGMHVSNWYLPAHWFFGYPGGSLGGAEALSREVFQFWIDDTANADLITKQAVMLKHELSHFHVE